MDKKKLGGIGALIAAILAAWFGITKPPVDPPPTTTTTTVVVEPSPTPEPTPQPTPTPTATPEAQVCPKELAEGASIRVDYAPYGQGLDSTVWVLNDPEFCRLIHGVSTRSCHLDGWPRRFECEYKLMGGCTTWEFSVGSDWETCFMPPTNVGINCDHHGSAGKALDDPKTPPFEGTPAICGLQRDASGFPTAGPFIIAHGLGKVRACDAKGENCGMCRSNAEFQQDGCSVNH